uniref:F-box domain-containing protein n=1 Tax=Caenorhabditis tropicalis TaxID=1561998 RepID=A0A1I7UTL2_9PELO
MNLLRLPLIVLKEVFKSMDFREKFLISFLSKRARNTLQLTCVIPHFSFHLVDDFHIHAGRSWLDRNTEEENKGNVYIGRQKMRLRTTSDTLILRENPIRKWLLMTGYLLATFKKSTISLGFHGTPAVSALDFIKMINQRQLCVTLVVYSSLVTQSSEFIRKILDECTEVTDLIRISAAFPDDFVYTPPRPFKAKKLFVGKINNWFNLEKFMNCLRISVEPERTQIGLHRTTSRSSQNG